MHEIKHDGYRLIVRRDGLTVRLFTRRGRDWTDRYPAIASAAVKLRVRSLTIDGEAVVTGLDGIAVFDALHRRRRAADAMLYAFDLMELNGKDLRSRRWTSARRSCWAVHLPVSCSTSTPMRMARSASSAPAGSDLKA